MPEPGVPMHSYAYLRRLTSDVLETAPVWDTHAHVGRDRDGRELDFIGLLRDLDDYRVNGAVIFPFNDPEQGTDFRVPNDRVWDAYRAAPERFVPFMRLNPNGPWEDEYERCRDRDTADQAASSGAGLRAERPGGDGDLCAGRHRPPAGTRSHRIWHGRRLRRPGRHRRRDSGPSPHPRPLHFHRHAPRRRRAGPRIPTSTSRRRSFRPSTCLRSSTRSTRPGCFTAPTCHTGSSGHALHELAVMANIAGVHPAHYADLFGGNLLRLLDSEADR